MTLTRPALIHVVCLALLVANGSLALANPVTSVHVFGPNEGSFTQGDLTLDGMTLYGVTRVGGNPADSVTLNGTVYKVDVDGGGFQVLHTFEDKIDPDPFDDVTFRQDGYSPQGGLVVGGGGISGVAAGGGLREGGTYYSLGTNGTGYAVNYQFDFAFPSFGITPNGDLNYGVGTTRIGGTNSNGTLLLPGAFVPFSMPGGAGVLRTPVGAMVSVGSTLFGQAAEGGAFGRGGVFKINEDGTGYQVLHSFAGGTDGGSPSTTMQVIGSKIYGTTPSSLFSMNLDGSGYQVLSNDAGGSNITHVGDRLYGTRGSTIWEIGLDGSNFQNLADGSQLSFRSGVTFVDLSSVSGGTWLYGTATFASVAELVYKVPFDVIEVPEPHSVLLAAVGLMTLAGYGWRTRRRRR